MHFKKPITYMIVFTVLSLPAATSAQTFGFGCLGLVGGYGGYSYQVYNPQGLNNYINGFNINHKDSLTSALGKFGKARGYRVGINLFRANIKGFILTTKGFYQYLSEKKSTDLLSSKGESTLIYEVDLKNWGVGIDLGTSISGALSWKVIDAALLFNWATFTNTLNSPGPTTIVKKYNNEKSTLGYTIGTGFILAIVNQYISLEGTAGYTVFSIDKMKSDNGTELTVSENSTEPMGKFISGGGFSAVVQLNIGFPL